TTGSANNRTTNKQAATAVIQSPALRGFFCGPGGQIEGAAGRRDTATGRLGMHGGCVTRCTKQQVGWNSTALRPSNELDLQYPRQKVLHQHVVWNALVSG